MSWSHLDGTLSNFFLAGLLLCIVLFKSIAFIVTRKQISDRSLFYFISPVMSPDALSKSQKTTPPLLLQRLHHAVWGGLALFGCCWLYGKIITHYSPSEIALSYLATPIVYFWGETLGPLGQALIGLTGRIPNPVHRWPHRAEGISNFWSFRWNTWTQDFFFTALFRPLQRRRPLATGVVFVVSGLLHELLINLPLYLYVHRNLFGSQLAYFLIQWAGVAIDRKYLRRFSYLRKLFLWIVVIGPAPLIVNEGLLRIIHVWP